MFGAVIISLLFTLKTPLQLPLGYGQAIILGLLISVFGQLGDLAESLLKRNFGVKDSGNSDAGARRPARPAGQHSFCRGGGVSCTIFWSSSNCLTSKNMEKLNSGAAETGASPDPSQLEKFETYYRELIDWNKRVNLTAITDYEEVQVKHFLDSLTVATVLGNDIAGKALNVIDVGTGAGFPGIPLKIVFPDIHLTLLEATAKKTKFFEHLVKKLDLKDVKIVPAGRKKSRINLNTVKNSISFYRARSPL